VWLGQRDLQDRRVGRIEFAIERAGRQVGGQVHGGGIDRRLDVVRGAVDVAVDVELDHDGRIADRGGGGDFGNPGNLPHSPLQRCRDRVRHSFRVSARASGENNNGGDVDAGQRRHRQEAIGDNAGQHEADRQQNGRHRAANEPSGEAHRSDRPYADVTAALQPGGCCVVS
jgi:hypothetical protein